MITIYKNKNSDGSLNICGSKIAIIRKNMKPKVSQRAFADMLQLNGLDLDKNAIQRIEAGKRFVTEIELKNITNIINESTDILLK